MKCKRKIMVGIAFVAVGSLHSISIEYIRKKKIGTYN